MEDASKAKRLATIFLFILFVFKFFVFIGINYFYYDDTINKNYIVLENDREKLRNTLIKETREEGIELGKQEDKKEIAKNMLNLGADLNFIAKSTGLSKEEINKLK